MRLLQEQRSPQKIDTAYDFPSFMVKDLIQKSDFKYFMQDIVDTKLKAIFCLFESSYMDFHTRRNLYDCYLNYKKPDDIDYDTQFWDNFYLQISNHTISFCDTSESLLQYKTHNIYKIIEKARNSQTKTEKQDTLKEYDFFNFIETPADKNQILADILEDYLYDFVNDKLVLPTYEKLAYPKYEYLIKTLTPVLEKPYNDKHKEKKDYIISIVIK